MKVHQLKWSECAGCEGACPETKGKGVALNISALKQHVTYLYSRASVIGGRGVKGEYKAKSQTSQR